MIRNRSRRALLLLAIALTTGSLGLDPMALAEPESRRFVLPGPRPVESAGKGGLGGGSWWLGTSGIVLALALFGAGSLMARRSRRSGEGGEVPMRVVGRASLSPRHAVVLLRVGDRTLMIGTGTQGPPTLLAEWAGSPPISEIPTPLGGGR